jgi:hypothetical protein
MRSGASFALREMTEELKLPMHKVIAGVSFVLLWCGARMSDTSAEQDQTINNFLAACAKNSKAWSECSFAVTTMRRPRLDRSTTQWKG